MKHPHASLLHLPCPCVSSPLSAYEIIYIQWWLLLLHLREMLFAQSIPGAKRAHLVRAKDRETTSSSFFCAPLLSPPPSSTSCYTFPTRECLCVRMTKRVCVSACAYTPSTWQGARIGQITSWRKHYSIAYSIQITQMFIATSATTGGEGWAFGRLAGLVLHGAVVSDALWQQVKRNWFTWVCHT